MGEKEKLDKAPQSILDIILHETFLKLDDNENFETELLSKLKKVKLPGNTSTEQKLTSIFRVNPHEDTGTGDL